MQDYIFLVNLVNHLDKTKSFNQLLKDKLTFYSSRKAVFYCRESILEQSLPVK